MGWLLWRISALAGAACPCCHCYTAASTPSSSAAAFHGLSQKKTQVEAAKRPQPITPQACLEHDPELQEFLEDLCFSPKVLDCLVPEWFLTAWNIYMPQPDASHQDQSAQQAFKMDQLLEVKHRECTWHCSHLRCDTDNTIVSPDHLSTQVSVANWKSQILIFRQEYQSTDPDWSDFMNSRTWEMIRTLPAQLLLLHRVC